MKTFAVCGIVVVLCVVQITALTGVQRELEETDELDERSSSCLMLMRDSNNCNNYHGYCKEGRNGYSCACYEGWGGRDCVDALKVQRELEETDELDERSSSCLMLMRDSNNCNNYHGYCKEGRNGYSCFCYEGWGGRDCVDALKTASIKGERELNADDKEPMSKRAKVLELLRRLLE